MRVKSMDFWYEFGSNYSYLSVMRIGAMARQAGVAVRWQPFLLGPIFKSLGWNTSPFVLQQQKGRYTWRDMERQCARYGLPWNKPSVFPRRALLPMRVAVLGKQSPWIEAFSKEMMTLNFALDREIDSAEVVGQVLVTLGLDAGPLIELATAEPNKERLRLQTERAQALGIFGAPSFVAAGELFWGNDRLEEAMQWAAQAPSVPADGQAL